MLKSPLTSVLNQSQSLSDLLDFTTKKNSSSARAQTSCLNMLALDFTSPNDFTRKMRAQTTWMETEVMIWRTVNCWYQFVRGAFFSREMVCWKVMCVRQATRSALDFTSPWHCGALCDGDALLEVRKLKWKRAFVCQCWAQTFLTGTNSVWRPEIIPGNVIQLLDTINKSHE